jgi:hypothetical protein
MGTIGYSRIGVPTPLFTANAGLQVTLDTVTFATNFSVTSGHAGKLVVSTVAGLTAGLPSLSANQDSIFRLKSSVGTLTINTSGADTFSTGGTTLALAQGAIVEIVADTSVWRVLGLNPITGLSADALGNLRLDMSTLSTEAAPLSTDSILTQRGTAAPKILAHKDTAIFMPIGYIAGLQLKNNVIDGTNDIDISAGSARDSTNVENLVLASAYTKQLDAAWAVGNNAGGLDTGSKTINTWYHVHLIKRPDTGVVDVLFSASATAPTLPTNYTVFRRIGSIRTDASNIIRPFVQVGDDFQYLTSITDVNAANGVLTRITVPLSVPTGVRVFARIDTACYGTTAGTNAILTALDGADVAPTTIVSQLINSNAAQATNGGQMLIRTDTNASIGSRSSAATAHIVVIRTVGWLDNRGKDF